MSEIGRYSSNSGILKGALSIFMIPSAVALVEIPFNIIQMTVGGVVAILLAKKIKNMKF